MLRRAATALPGITVGIFFLLGATLVLGRFPLPGGDSFGFNSLARNLVLVGLAAHLLRAPGLRLRRSFLGTPFLAYLVAATISVAANAGGRGDLHVLAVVIGVFFVARALADGPAGPAVLFHWLGLVAVGVVAREVLHEPRVLLLRESSRFTLVTDHANTLGYVFAIVAPLFVGAIGRSPGGAVAAVYAVSACFGVLISFSRAAWAGLVIGLVALALAARPRRSAVGFRIAAVAAAATVAVAAVRVSFGRMEADWQRLRIIEASLTLFLEHPLFGVGYGVKSLSRLFPARYIELHGSSLFLYHSHNFYVDVLAGTGILGAAAAAWLVWRLARLAGRALYSASAATRLAAASYAVAIATFLAIGLFDMPFYHARLALVLAVAWALIESRVEALARPDSPARGG